MGNDDMDFRLPRSPWEYTVPIIIGNQSGHRSWATGVLWQCGQDRFLVTAAHSIREAVPFENEFLYVPGTDVSGIVYPVHYGWKLTGASLHERESRDVAILRLSDELCEHLSFKRFLNQSQTSDRSLVPEGVYGVFGYPGVWTKPTEELDLFFEGMPFASSPYLGDQNCFLDYVASRHLLLFANRASCTYPDGTHGDLPNDLSGISGSGAWPVGDSSWKPVEPCLIGLHTHEYVNSEVFRATKWREVEKLGMAAFPTVRKSLSLILPHSTEGKKVGS